MKLTTIVAFAILLSTGTIALADTQQTEDKVRKVIEASLKGECSDMLSTMIKSACESQLASSIPVYQQLGPLKDLAFKGYENTPNGQAMVFQATHQNGKMLWMAIEAPDGKLSTFWSPGPSQ